MQVDTAQQAGHLYSELKFWIPLITAGGFLWKAFQGISWLKDLKKDLDGLKSGLESQLAQQTNAIVGELKEIRQDFRLALAPPPRLRAKKQKIVDVSLESVL